MRLKSSFVFSLFVMIFIGWFVAVDGSAAEAKPPFPFPSYGSGPVEVRIYSDYFCSPCRATEPDVKPILNELLKKKALRLILVDTPFHQHTALFARYFLYAIKANHEMEHLFRVRQIFLRPLPTSPLRPGNGSRRSSRRKGFPSRSSTKNPPSTAT